MAGSDWYRNVPMQRLDDLRDVSVQAERLYLRLACGRFSTRTGLVRYRAPDLAVECRLRPSEVERGLEELAAARLLLWDKSAAAVYLLGFCSAFAPLSPDNRSAWIADAVSFVSPDLASQAMKEIESRKATGVPTASKPKATGVPTDHTRADQKQDAEAEAGTEPPPHVAAAPSPASPAARPDGTEGKQEALALAPAPSPSSAAPLPCMAILDLWAECLPTLPQPRKWEPDSKLGKALAKAWKADPHESLWRSRWERMAHNPFVTAQWKPDLLRMVTAGEEIDGGRYDRKAFDAVPPKAVQQDYYRNGDNY